MEYVPKSKRTKPVPIEKEVDPCPRGRRGRRQAKDSRYFGEKGYIPKSKRGS